MPAHLVKGVQFGIPLAVKDLLVFFPCNGAL